MVGDTSASTATQPACHMQLMGHALATAVCSGHTLSCATRIAAYMRGLCIELASAQFGSPLASGRPP